MIKGNFSPKPFAFILNMCYNIMNYYIFRNNKSDLDDKRTALFG